MTQAIILTGTTAVGKSALAIELAQALQGVVINGDSMQVYRDLPVLTAQPSPAQQRTVPHKLFGIFQADDVCSAGRWCILARDAITTAHAEGLTPIVCGGTGFYLKALTEGLAAIPDTDPLAEKALMAMVESHTVAALHAQLSTLDPDHGIPPTDTQRILRAMAVYETTGIPLSQWQREGKPQLPDVTYHVFAMPTPEDLEGRIRRRIEAMVKGGALEELASFLRTPHHRRTPLLRALGVRELGAYLQGHCTLDEAQEKLAISTRRYAKRQRTWLRTQMHHAITIDSAADVRKHMPQAAHP